MIAAAPQKKKESLIAIDGKIIPVVGRVNNSPLLLAFVKPHPPPVGSADVAYFRIYSLTYSSE